MASHSRIQLENWLKTIEVKGRVLDCGGSQNPIKGRTKTWDVEDYKILDLEKPHEVKQKPDIVADINSEQKATIIRVDVAFCIEVMEYIWDPFTALKNINALLKTGGVLYISFHFIYEIHQPQSEDCLRYAPAGALRLLGEAGFEADEVINKTFANPQNASNLFNGEGMRGIKSLHNIQGCLIKAIKI